MIGRPIAALVLVWSTGLSACQQPPVDFDPDDADIAATIDSIVREAMLGARDVDADRVLAMAEGGELSFITGDIMLFGLERIRETFRETYSGVQSQEQTVIEQRVRLVAPDVAIVTAVSEGRYTDLGGWTSDLVGMGHTIVFVRENGQWRARHAHQSIAD